MTHEDYVTFEQGKALKDLGFDWECIFWYHPNEDDKTKRFKSYESNHNKFKRGISAPTQAVAAKWLREQKGYNIEVKPEGKTWGYIISEFDKGNQCYDLIFITDGDDDFETYEEALSDALDLLLGFLKEANKNQDL